jgi:membrane protease YdiL (CAAX protease family)
MRNLYNLGHRPIAMFLFITFGLSSIFYFFIIYSGTMVGAEGRYVTGLMWCPGISALITLRFQKRHISDLGWQWGKTKYQIWSYIIPILYALIAYTTIWLFGWGGFYNKDFVKQIIESYGLGIIPDGTIITLYVILNGVFGTIRSTANSLGEEIGWRGFLVPELFKSFGYTKTSVISGLIWSVWHFPILLFADYNSGTPSWYAMSCFTVSVISISFVLTWFRIKSDSLWTAVLLHASHNLFIQAIFTPLTIDTGNTKYFIDEFGVILPIVCVGFAIFFWTKRNELVTTPNSSYI